MDETYITVTEAAHLTGYQRQTVLHWIRRSFLPAVRVGRSWMIRRADLLAYEPERSAFGAAQEMPQYLRVKYGNNTQAVDVNQTVQSNDI
jgi:excisionase family DNA binding protein